MPSQMLQPLCRRNDHMSKPSFWNEKQVNTNVIYVWRLLSIILMTYKCTTANIFIFILDGWQKVWTKVCVIFSYCQSIIFSHKQKTKTKKYKQTLKRNKEQDHNKVVIICWRFTKSMLTTKFNKTTQKPGCDIILIISKYRQRISSSKYLK